MVPAAGTGCRLCPNLIWDGVAAMAHGRFGIAVNCMDGRVQLPVIAWMKEQFHLDYVDMITEPGMDGFLGAGSDSQAASIKTKVMISMEKHGSRILVVAGHDDCAGNPVAPEQHREHLLRAVEKILAWGLPLDKVIAVWLDRDWKVKLVASR